MKIMIADDEVIIRTGLAEVIQWKDLGLTMLPPAESAEEVLERIEVERPDILMTDIRMTGKSGLELAEKVRDLIPDLEVIILSGYDDFIYTQQAIRQRVSDYLLKTSRPEDIVRTVLKAKQRVEERRVMKSRDYFQSREQRYRLLKRYVIDGEPLHEDIETMLADRSWTAGRWQVLVLSAEGWGQSVAEQSLLLFGVDNMVADLLSCVSFVNKDSVIVAAAIGEAEQEKRLRRLAFDKIERLLKCKLTVVGGEVVESHARWHASYLTAMEAGSYKLMIGRSQWEYADIHRRQGGQTVCTFEEERELSLKLLEDDPIALKLWVQQYIHRLLEDPEVTPQSLEAAVQSVVIAAHRWIERVLAAIGRERPNSVSLPTLLYKLDRVPNDALFQHLHMIMKLYHHYYADGKAAYIQKAMVYIDEQIGIDLSLQRVAEFVHLHPNHLSDIFKKETGMKFVDYVTRKKMERAAEILASSPSKISEVAARVGYEDIKYFGQMFKKYSGLTPSEYRERALAK